MAKFNENELTENLKEYNEKAKISLEFEIGIEGKIELNDASAMYNKQTGFINISGNNCNLKINTTMVNKYEKVNNEIKIDLETIILKISK